MIGRLEFKARTHESAVSANQDQQNWTSATTVVLARYARGERSASQFLAS